MLTFQVVDWLECKEEMKPLSDLLWEEMEKDKDVIRQNIDYEFYDLLDKCGRFCVIAAKDNGKIVGYHWLIIIPNPHAIQSLTAITDRYFLHPDYRKGFNGINFLKFTECEMKEFGVQRIICTTKIKNDKSAIFTRLGWEKDEIAFTKILN